MCREVSRVRRVDDLPVLSERAAPILDHGRIAEDTQQQPSEQAGDAVRIYDTERVVHQVWIDVFADYGCSFSLEEWLTAVGTEGGFDPYGALVERSSRSLPPRDELARRTHEDERRMLAGLGALPGVDAWIDGARRTGLSLAVASSSPRAWVEERLAEVGLSQTFAVVSCRGSDLAAKPAPDVYLDACRRLGVEPARSVAVEDSLNGLAAARAAGMRCVAVPGAVTSGLDLGAADLVLGSLGEMSLDDALCHLVKRTDR